MNHEYRHVCFKDLELYLRKDDYFEGLTPKEQEIIRKNLGITTSTFTGTIVEADYNTLEVLSEAHELVIGYTYILKDFQTTYEIDGKLFGIDIYPSEKYDIALTPINNSEFNSNVIIVGKLWEVQFDFKNKKITYLKDENGNSAYYDFKNVRFKRTPDELNKGPKYFDITQYLYTFDLNGQESSSLCKNITLGEGCINNVFLNVMPENTTFLSDCHSNTFFKGCSNCEFAYHTFNNYFITNPYQVKGSVHDKTLAEEIDLDMPKSFSSLNGNQVLIYFDLLTQTHQVRIL